MRQNRVFSVNFSITEGQGKVKEHNIAELEKQLVCRECLKKAWSGPLILQPILHRKPVRTDLLLCDRRQTSAPLPTTLPYNQAPLAFLH